METKIVYLDESGDSGEKDNSRYGSPYFILSSVSMDASDWQSNFNQFKNYRRMLKAKYGWHITEEMHAKDFLFDHNPYRKYGWDYETRRRLFLDYISCIGYLKIESVSVIIDKSIIVKPTYRVLENALKYNIQRIDNTYHDNRNFIVISDTGRIGEMRKIARSICAYNQVPTESFAQIINKPIKSMIEDIIGKDSSDSYFIQIADCISYVVNLYFKVHIKKQPLPGRVSNILSESDLIEIMNYFDQRGVFNKKASTKNEYGLVIYPK